MCKLAPLENRPARTFDLRRLTPRSLTPAEIFVSLSRSIDQDCIRDDVFKLDTRELEQIARFRNPIDAERYQYRHRLLRQLLADVSGLSPNVIRFATKPSGKPYMVAEPSVAPPHFNLSSSDDAVLIGLSNQVELGVDIECHREWNELEAVAEHVLHAEEYSAWRELPESEKLPRFFDLWTMKEAALKCLGVGLAVEPASFQVLAADGDLFQCLTTGDGYCLANVVDYPTVVIESIAIREGISAAIAMHRFSSVTSHPIV